MTAPQLNVNPGSVEFESLRILQDYSDDTGFDITNIMVQLDIYESLYSPYINGSVLLYDSLSLISQLPMIGDELIEISFRIPHPFFENDPIKLKCRIVSVKDMVIENARTAQYILEFVSEERVYDVSRRVRKAYMNMPISDMVQQLYDDYLKNDDNEKKITVDETAGERTIVIPNMHPMKAMYFLASEAESTGIQFTDTDALTRVTGRGTKTSNFIFYEDLAGFHFTTMESLIYGGKQKINQNFEIMVYNLREQNLQSDTDEVKFVDRIRNVNYKTMPIQFSKIQSYRFVHFYDRIKEIQNGKFENKVLIIDPVKQIYREQTLTYDQAYEDMEPISVSGGKKTTGDESIYSKLNEDMEKIGDGHVRMLLSSEAHNDDIPANQRPDFLNHLVMSLANLNSIVVNLNVPGNTKIRPGDVIAINFPEFGGTDDIVAKTHKLLSGGKDSPGYFFVTHIRHSYNKQDGYNLSLEVVKNVHEDEVKPVNIGL